MWLSQLIKEAFFGASWDDIVHYLLRLLFSVPILVLNVRKRSSGRHSSPFLKYGRGFLGSTAVL